MDKRIERIQKWLNRCALACKASAWSSALMEAECLEAEVHAARSALWEKALGAPEKQPLHWRWICVRGGRALFVSLILLLALVIPLSDDAERSPLPAGRRDHAAGTYTWVSYDEGKLLEALRRDLSDNNAGRVVASAGKKEAAPPVRTVQGGVSAGTVETRGEKTPERQQENQRNADEDIRVEEVLSLIRVGQRALRRVEPAVEVLP